MIAIIQARSNSKRFKNKVLKLIHNKTMIEHVYDRVKRSKLIKKIFVATSTNKTDDKLAKHLKTKRINYFRGDLSNVAKRLLDLAKKKKLKYFMRISGDSPLIDYKIINTACKIYIKSNNTYHIITNLYPRTFPKGQSVEIIKTSILKQSIKSFSNSDKEHVTKYFYNNASKFKIKNFYFKGKTKIKNQSVDKKKDLDLIIKKYNKNLKN